MTDLDPKKWSGKIHSYRPAPDWKERVDSRLRLHEDAAAELDPTDFEVIRQKLWTINLAHGDTITRISGSPVLATLDFNMSILTEDADVVMNAPYIQFLNAGAPLGIRYTMENYAAAPGIDEGDIYCCNDPWIAACHQMDVLFAAPIFYEGRLFGWTANAGHQYDLGGIVPGGWPQNAEDVYSDPVVLPPFKLVEKGVMRKDLEALYLRQSRLPDMVALDLRAQLAGVRFARDQIVQLCDRFGAPTVKAAMRLMVDQAQENFRKKLLSIPDGTWTETRYIDEPMPSSRTTQRTRLSVTKTGDRLMISNEGTDAQTPGTNGIPFVTWAGSITGIVSVSMLYEQLFAYGGSERQIDYDAHPGTLTCVDYPAAVSGGILHAVTMMNAMQAILSRMMAAAEDLKGDIVAPCAEFMLPVLIGFNDRGEYFGQAILDGFACGSGARSFGDGIDTGGPNFSPLSMILNVEQLEQWYPILCLYRRSDPDSGGAGKWRGGNGLRLGVTPYRAQTMDVVTNTGGQGATSQNGQGLLGGLPSPASHYVIRKQTGLTAMMSDKRLPQTAFDIAAEETIWLSPKSNGTPLHSGDIFEFRVGGGGGYGDPLDRDPDLVARDVQLGAISADAARAIYGVDPDDRDARTKVREARRGWKRQEQEARQSVSATGEAERPVHEYVVAADRDGERILACSKCGERLGGYSESYKNGALVGEIPVAHIPTAPDPARFLDDEMVLRLFACPGCLTQISAEVVRAGEPVFEEMQLKPADFRPGLRHPRNAEIT